MTGTTEQENVATARRYLAAIEAGATGEALAAFFTPDVVQVELPNRLVPGGARRDLAAILDGAVRGRQVVAAQRFEVVGVVASGDRVALEAVWTGTLRVPLGSLPAGGGDARALRRLPRVPRRPDRRPAQLRLLRAVVAPAAPPPARPGCPRPRVA
jgi:ketosteroid isomerase-like protein